MPSKHHEIAATSALLRLAAARHLYERAGSRLAREERHHSFGHELFGQH